MLDGRFYGQNRAVTAARRCMSVSVARLPVSECDGTPGKVLSIFRIVLPNYCLTNPSKFGTSPALISRCAIRPNQLPLSSTRSRKKLEPLFQCGSDVSATTLRSITGRTTFACRPSCVGQSPRAEADAFDC